MKKLFLGEVLQVRGGEGTGITCDICKEKDKKCVVIEVPYYVTKYETEYKSSLFSLDEVVKDFDVVRETTKIDICGDCAGQIYKQLKA